MKACIICFGDEILQGSIVNTNAAFISKSLNEAGISVVQQLTLSDFDDMSESFIRSMSLNHDIIVCSGGLGPTVDDMTRPLFAKLAQTEIYFDEDIYQDLVKKFGDEPYHKIQAMLPRGAIFLPNLTGTAKGLCIELNKALIFAIPGVPHEMKTMLINEVIPLIEQKLGKGSQVFEKTLCFFDLIEVQLDPHIKKLQFLYPDVKFGIYPSYGIVKVTFQSSSEIVIENIKKYFVSEFSSWIYAHDSSKIEQIIFDVLKSKKQTLALAESITGGDIARRLVALAGVSSIFLGSFVTYSNEMKKSILGVSEDTLRTHGAVSEQTALEMLSGTLIKTKCDFAIAVTGIAGPANESVSKPIGLVYIAVGSKSGDQIVHECHFKGDRDIIIEKASTYALGYLLQLIRATK